MSNNKQPAHKIRDGLIVATIWENVNKDGEIFHSVNLTRSYKDAEGWKETTSLAGSELLIAAHLLHLAYGWIRQSGAGAPEDEDGGE